MEENKKLYLCDPERNRECGKQSCGTYHQRGRCFSTKRRAYAKTDENGVPIEWPLKIGTFIQDRAELTQVLVDMNKIREVGIVNAREDLETIDKALKWLTLLDAMLQ